MKYRGHNPSTDANQAPIVDALREVGAHVVYLKQPVDLLVGWRSNTFLLEVKRPLGPRGGKNGSTLTPDQTDFFRDWRGGTLVVVRSVDEALAAIGALK